MTRENVCFSVRNSIHHGRSDPSRGSIFEETENRCSVNNVWSTNLDLFKQPFSFDYYVHNILLPTYNKFYIMRMISKRFLRGSCYIFNETSCMRRLLLGPSVSVMSLYSLTNSPYIKQSFFHKYTTAKLRIYVCMI